MKTTLSLVFAIASIALLTGCANNERKKSDEMWTTIATRQDDPTPKANDSGIEGANQSAPNDVDREEYARKFDVETDTF